MNACNEAAADHQIPDHQNLKSQETIASSGGAGTAATAGTSCTSAGQAALAAW